MKRFLTMAAGVLVVSMQAQAALNWVLVETSSVQFYVSYCAQTATTVTIYDKFGGALVLPRKTAGIGYDGLKHETVNSCPRTNVHKITYNTYEVFSNL